MNTFLDSELEKHKYKNPSLQWEIMKIGIAELSQHFSKRKANERKAKRAEIEKKLRTQEKRLSCLNLKSAETVKTIQKVNSKIDQLKLELDQEQNHVIQGTLLRSGARYYEHGEKNTKYFFELEKRNARSRNMSSVYNSQNQLVTGTNEVLKVQADFYKELYKKDNTVKFNMVTPPEKKLSPEKKEELDRDITLEELGKALYQAKNSKAPGLDGIPADFLKVFFGKIKHLLLAVLKECFHCQRIFTSGRRGVISLIPQKNRDLRWVKNWRPIILLCADYKLFAKIISNRIKEVLQENIHSDQSAFLKGRNISDNIRRIIDTIDFCDRNKINSLLIQLDFEKAFDRVDYDSLERTMLYLGFGEKITNWVRILFSDFQLCTMNNGYLSPFFSPSRGLFQGNPFSCYGFIMIIELFAILVRSDKKIEGVKIGKLVSLLSIFADDLVLFIQNKGKVWYAVQEAIDCFEASSGLKINYDKSNIYRLGSARNSNARFYSRKKLQWSDGSIDALGVIVNTKKIVELNIDPILQKIENVLNTWKHRDLSLLGKILVINSLAASLLMYRLAVLPLIKEKYYKMYEQIIKKFLWNSTKAKIPFKILEGLKENGGLNLNNIRKRDIAMKANWVVRIKLDPLISEMANQSLDNPIGDLLWQTSLSKRDIQQIFPKFTFWRDVLEAWNEVQTSSVEKREEVLNSVIWYNSNIRIDKKVILF